MSDTDKRATAANEAARAAAIAALDAYEARDGNGFSWPLDGIANRGFGYALHTKCVEAWNAENRVTGNREFTRRWLTTPGNVEAAMEYARSLLRAHHREVESKRPDLWAPEAGDGS